MSGYRTPLARARGLGSAKRGVGHFIGERVSSVALVPLMIWAIVAAVRLAGRDYDGAVQWLRFPVNATLLALFILVGAYHMRIGMRVIIEDYIERPSTKAALLLINLFVAWGAAALALVCVMKVAFGGWVG